MRNNNSWYAIVLVVLWVLLIMFLLIWWIFTTKVPPRYTAIKVDLYGNDKWVTTSTLWVWRSWVNPITTDIYLFPTFVQQKEYSSITFQDIDWLTISSNFWLDYQFKPELISKIFESYNANSEKITNELMATWIKSNINRVSSKYKVDEIYWPKKEQFRIDILESIKKDLDDKWIVVANIYFVWEMILPANVMQRITDKIQATQTAMQKENELRAVEAEAAKEIAQAKWYNEAQIIRAKADAEAIRIKTEAIKSQWGAEYVQLQAIEKWNGTLPVTTLGNNVPFINLK